MRQSIYFQPPSSSPSDSDERAQPQLVTKREQSIGLQVVRSFAVGMVFAMSFALLAGGILEEVAQKVFEYQYSHPK